MTVVVDWPSGGKKIGTIVPSNEPETHVLVQFDDRPEPMRVHVSHVRW